MRAALKDFCKAEACVFAGTGVQVAAELWVAEQFVCGQATSHRERDIGSPVMPAVVTDKPPVRLELIA